MRAKDALERSLTKLPGSVLALCCAELLLRCTQCLCSFLGCTGAELISLVMVWLPPARFPLALSIPLPSVHSTWVQANTAYRGGVKKSRGSGQPFSMGFFSAAEMESG